MSRVGKMPIAVPKGVDVQITADQITVKGANGTLVRAANGLVTVKNDAGVLNVAPANDSAEANAMSGTMRALLANMVDGVGKGFEKKLSLVGVGFRAAAQGSKLNLQVGFSHPVVKEMPEGVKVECPTQTEIVIKGADRQAVGQVAAEVRAIRPPEPYKGKGIRYVGERSCSRKRRRSKEPHHADQERTASAPRAPDPRSHREASAWPA
jgi:large subunit ribosomal protein L6